MSQKLTLQLDKEAITIAKKYARNRKTSVSKLVEDYFRLLDAPEIEGLRISPRIQSLIGVVTLPEGVDADDARLDYLLEKYQ